MRRGNLTVLLDPRDPLSPRLQLRVTMRLWHHQPSPHGPLLIHNGGPGTDDSECCQNVSGYDVWMISQRGVGPEASPALRCQDSHMPATPNLRRYSISDFTDCPCALPDGAPMQGMFWADLDPMDEAQVQRLFKLMAKRARPCYESDKFQLRGRDLRTYNFLDYVGTSLLAQDIDVMRRAVGAPKMSIWGNSYGSRVGGVYATMFPGRTGRLVLEGNLSPLPRKDLVVLGFAQSAQIEVDALLEQCRYHRSNCSLREPDEDFREVIALARAGKLTARAASKPPWSVWQRVTLTVGMLLGYLHGLLKEEEGWQLATKVLGMLLARDTDRKARNAAVRTILDRFCCVKGVRTWFEYGVCVGPGQTAEAEGCGFSENTFAEQAAVMGADLVGRYSVQSALGLWRTVKLQYGDVGTTAFLGLWGAIFRWPALAAPPPPIGNPTLPVLIHGNLFDVSTGFHWAQQTRSAFPAGALMTWQGIGHCAPWYLHGGGALYPCLSALAKYLDSGTLPQDGFVCRLGCDAGAVPGVRGVTLGF